MDWAIFATLLAACGAAAATGAMFQPGRWYDGLDKPWWTPPGWAFPVAWTTLYLCMAAAGARVAPMEGSGQAMAFWALQIAFNTLWSPVFFGLRRMRASMIVMAGLWLSVFATFLAFLNLDPIAGALLAPYVLWVTIAGALNWSVWRRNPDEDARNAVAGT
jgi:tryptophan-rich sensory protein